MAAAPPDRTLVAHHRIPRWWLGVAVLAFAALSALASVLAGAPAALPAVALSSAVLFHVERCVAIFVPCLLMFGAVCRGLRGELPVEFGRDGVKYADEADGLDDLRVELRGLRNAVASLRHSLRDEETARLALTDAVRDLGGPVP